MNRLLKELVYGEGLRHRPIALAAADQRPVRARAVSADGVRDVSSVVFPLSLHPLILAIARGSDEPAVTARELHMAEPGGDQLGAIRLAGAGAIEHANGFLDLFRPTGAAVSCVPGAYQAWRYVTAWRRVQTNARQPHAFHMDFADLKALNVFYILPRPVHLVTVVHRDKDNLFPMDLVGPLGDELFLLALRKTSPSIELMREGGKIVLSGMPARMKDAVYRLGAHHKTIAVDWTALEFATRPSPLFGWPVPVDALDVRELEVRQCEEIGSHLLFVTRVAGFSRGGDGPQLCHVSDMYARWRAAQGRPFADA